MKTEIVYVKPKSEEATHFFDHYMKKRYACKVLSKSEEKILLQPILTNYSFWFNENNDKNWRKIGQS